MENVIYVCNDCLFYSNMDFWECPKCLDEVKVTQIGVKIIDKALTFTFYREDNINPEQCHKIVEHYVEQNEITHVSIYSQHNYQLDNIYFEVIVKLS